MLVLHTLRDPLCCLYLSVSRTQPEYDIAVPTPSYIPLESGIMEGYKRLEQITLPFGYLKIPLLP
jgi:hypothetical protein